MSVSILPSGKSRRLSIKSLTSLAVLCPNCGNQAVRREGIGLYACECSPTPWRSHLTACGKRYHEGDESPCIECKTKQATSIA